MSSNNHPQQDVRGGEHESPSVAAPMQLAPTSTMYPLGLPTTLMHPMFATPAGTAYTQPTGFSIGFPVQSMQAKLDPNAVGYTRTGNPPLTSPPAQTLQQLSSPCSSPIRTVDLRREFDIDSDIIVPLELTCTCMIGNKPPRSALDTRTTNDKSCFWQELRAAFVQILYKDDIRNKLMFEDDFFVGIDPSVVKEHSAKKLFDMRKEVNSFYIIAEKKFNTSGQMENEFRNFVDTRGYVLYLRKWLGVKPELNRFVQAGMLEEDQLDTLDAGTTAPDASATATGASGTPQTAKHRRLSDSSALDGVASSFAAYVQHRREESELARTSLTIQLQEKSSILALLSDIRSQLASCDRDMTSAEGAAKKRLEEDRELLLQERLMLIEKLKAIAG